MRLRATALRSALLVLTMLLGVFLVAGCGPDRAHETDAQLGLNVQQSAGRAIFNERCASCHYPYSSKSLHGPGLDRLYRKKYLPSGLPTNDRFVTQTILNGRGMMPAAGSTLSDEQLRELIAYLQTL